MTMELFENLPSPKGDKKVLRDLKDRERTAVVPARYTLVQTNEQLMECALAIQAARFMSFDTETTGLNWTDYAVAVGIAVRTPNGIRSWMIPTSMQYAMRNFSSFELKDVLGDLFESTAIGKVGHNVKFDMHRMKNTYKMPCDGIRDDTMIAQTVLNENEGHSLDDIIKNWLPEVKSNWKIKQDGHFNVWPLKMATNYLCADAENTLLIHEWQQTILPQYPKLRELYYSMEMPNLLIAYEMEQHGIAWDNQYYNDVMKPEVQGKRAAAKIKCQAVLGPINLDSPLQVSAALFDGIGLERIDGNSVNKKVLARLRKSHPVIVDLEEYRKYATLDKMFVEELPGHVHGGRIHPSFRTYGTKTGRWSCTDPNLQQLPKASVGPLIRRGFIPTAGHVLVTMDYSQIELRLLAHISGDENLVRAFESGEDIHTATCLLMFAGQVTLADLVADKDHPLRVRSKTINFGILYGMGPMKLMDTINMQAKKPEDMITLDQAKALIEQWFNTFPRAKKYISAMKVLAFKQGYVETIMGRKRRLPDARHQDRAISSMAERQAVNSPIQGSAADMLKLAQIKIDAFLRETNYPYKMMLAVHDELVFEVPLEWFKHNRKSLVELSEIMRDAIVLKVPVKVSVDVLQRWGDRIPDEDLDLEDDLAAA